MKKIMKIASLLACVSLSGCDLFGKRPVATEPKISIGEIPQAKVGEKLDFSSFVTCEGGGDSFYITVDETSAEFAEYGDASRHSLVASHSGEVSFTVHYGELTEEGKVTFYSDEYFEFAEATKDVGYNFGIYFLDDNWQNYSAFYNYGENFVVDWIGGEGIAEIDGRCYEFSLSEEGDEIESYSVGVYTPESLEGYSAPFMIDGSALKPHYNPEEVYQGKTYPAYESLYCEDINMMGPFVENYFGYSMELLQQNDLTPTKLEFVKEEYEYEGETVVEWDTYLYVYGELTDGSMGEGMLDLLILGFGEDYYYADDLAEMIAAKAPEGKDMTNFIEKFDAAFALQNFTVEYSAGWFNSLGKSISSPFFTEQATGNMINEYLNCSSGLTAYVTPTQTYVENGDAAHSKGLVYNEGVYGYSGENHNAFEIDDSISSIFDESLIGEGVNYLLMTSDSEGYNIFKDAFVNQTKEAGNGKTWTFEFAASTTPGLFGYLFQTALPRGNEIDEKLGDTDVYAYLAQYENLYWTADIILNGSTHGSLDVYLDVLGEANIDASGNLESLKLSFVWDDEDLKGNEINYIMSVTFKNFGTTSIPAGVVVNY